jgi:hypothetical protein
VIEFRCDLIEDAMGLSDDFRTDAVTRQKNNAGFHGSTYVSSDTWLGGWGVLTLSLRVSSSIAQFHRARVESFLAPESRKQFVWGHVDESDDRSQGLETRQFFHASLITPQPPVIRREPDLRN